MAAEAAACLSAEFFDGLAALKDTFTNNVFAAMGKQARPVLSKMMVVWILWQGIQMGLKAESATERLKKILEKGLLVAICAIALLPSKTNPAPLIYQWAITPFEEMTLAYGSEVLDVMATVDRGGAKSPYGQLACGVETQIFGFLELIGRIITDNYPSWKSMLSGGFLVTVLACLMLMVPFAFVISIFAAFLLEAMFKVTAFGIVAPLTIFCIPFEPLRPFAIAALRVVLGAGLTVIFAAGAMGFTMQAVDIHGHRLYEQMNPSGAARAEAEAAQKEWEQRCAMSVDATSPECVALLVKKMEAEQKVTNDFHVFTREYFLLFVLGFASILLHLSAKSLASNISGANDGAGPAAATVAAAKATLGAGAYYGSRALFGAGGARSSVIGALSPGRGLYDSQGAALTGGQLIQQHGMVGGVMARMAQGMGAGAESAQMAARRTAPSMSAGGGNAELTATLQELNKTLQGFNGGKGGAAGRTRTG